MQPHIPMQPNVFGLDVVRFVHTTVLVGALLVPSAALAQAGTGIIRVHGATGTDVGGCGSVAQPCATIQKAVHEASSRDTIRVAGGTYVYDVAQDTLCTTFVRTTAVVCILNKELTILGGFTTANWTTANPSQNVTTIDGEDIVRGVLVMQTSPTAPNATLDMEGFTVTRGLAQGKTSGGDLETFAFGGGLSAVLADVTLRDMSFSNNQVVGGNTSSGHGGSGSGGGVALRGSSTSQQSATFAGITFTGNQARGGTGPDRGGLGLGGGLFTNYVTLVGDDLTFTNNTAVGGNSAGSGLSSGLHADALGGGASFEIGSIGTLTNVIGSGNNARGGDADAAGGGFGGHLFAERATLSVTDADLRQGESRGGNGDDGGLGAGGAVMTTRSDVTMNRTVMIDNLSAGGVGATKKGSAGGGAGYFSRVAGTTTISVSNSIIADNTVELGTGGGASGGGGGGFFLIGADLNLSHSTLARNRLSTSPLQGQAIVLVTGSLASVADIVYTVIADHTDYSGTVVALHVQPGSTANLNNGLWAGNDDDHNNGNPSLPSGTFTGLASMLSAAAADFVSPGPLSFNYHIQSSSPAIDQALGSSETLDFEQQARDGAPDIGADELGAGSPVFSDGFESGNTSAWSASVP